MKTWVFTFRVEPPEATVLARFGSSVFDAFYSKIIRQWYHVVPGGTLEKIAEPQMIFVSEDYAKAHATDIAKTGRRPAVRLREGKQKFVQYELAI